MVAGFTMLLAKIVAALVWIGELFVAVFVAIWDWIRDAVCWPFEQIMEIAVAAIQALDLSGITAHVSAWGSLPGEIINVLGLLGVGEASAIIVAAITLRLLLQLIPFVRLGS